MKKYVIVPGCSDLNRGDQALVWETKRLAEEAGYIGQYYLTSEKNEPTEQSKKRGIEIIPPVLEHPSRKFKNKENINYTKTLIVKWGIVALFDLLKSLLILWKPTRNLLKYIMDADKRNAINVIEESDVVFMKGGGLLQSYGGLTSTYSMYFGVYPILLAHRLGKPVFIMPNSFGPFEGPFVKNIARMALQKCKILTSRETISARTIKEQLGIDIQNYADLAFELPKADLNKDKLYEEYNLPKDRKLVAVTMRPYRFYGFSDPTLEYNRFKQEMAGFIGWLYDQGYMPVIVEHTLAVNAHENDGACIKEVINLLDSSKYRLISDKSYDCMDLKCIYSFCDYIVGTRFHSIIFAFGSNIPGIAIAYTGNKTQGIMHDIGLDNYVIDITEVNTDVLITKFNELLLNETDTIDRIKKYGEKAKCSRIELIEICRRN